MNGLLRVPRSRGVLSGLLLVLLGAWGALVPFIGPYFHYAYTPDQGWTYTTGRLWLEVLPGAATVLGGLIVMVSAYRPMAHFGAWLAALAGAWFALGSVIAPTWIGMNMTTGTPVGGSAARARAMAAATVCTAREETSPSSASAAAIAASPSLSSSMSGVS